MKNSISAKANISLSLLRKLQVPMDHPIKIKTQAYFTGEQQYCLGSQYTETNR